jgi:hypothetical protein
MYQNMMFGVKRRILNEIEGAFLNHPQFTEKVTVVNKFPQNERVQYGVVLRNTSASQVRMSADNYMADIYSHVRLIKQKDHPGTSIEWVKEDEPAITVREEEDFTVDPTQRLYTVRYPVLSGPGNTTPADNAGQVRVTINGAVINAEALIGQGVLLPRAPNVGDVLKMSYYRRAITDPGLYQISFLSDDQFVVSVMYEITGEVLIQNTTGLETTVTLQRAPITPNSERLYFDYLNKDSNDGTILLLKGTDYSIDDNSGVITFLHPLATGYILKIDYYTKLSEQSTPFSFGPYQEVHNAIPGVVICMGRRAVLGDVQVIGVSQLREPQARIYGGHWNMALSLGVISKDTKQMEEMTDQLVNWLWGVRKNVLEFEGITLNRVEPTGETEEAFIESTGDLYYESAVDIDVMSEWQKFVPYPFKLRLFNIALFSMEPDTRTVIKFPTVGYETVS